MCLKKQKKISSNKSVRRYLVIGDEQPCDGYCQVTISNNAVYIIDLYSQKHIVHKQIFKIYFIIFLI